MALAIRNKRDFWSGVMFTAFGVSFTILSTQYDMGAASAMGPGWFPFALGVILTGLGLLIIINAARTDGGADDVEPIGWRELGLILASIALFAWALPFLGLVISVTLLTIVSALAGHERRPLEIALVAVALVALCYGVFVRGLGLPLAVWPIFPGF